MAHPRMTAGLNGHRAYVQLERCQYGHRAYRWTKCGRCSWCFPKLTDVSRGIVGAIESNQDMFNFAKECICTSPLTRMQTLKFYGWIGERWNPLDIEVALIHLANKYSLVPWVTPNEGC